MKKMLLIVALLVSTAASFQAHSGVLKGLVSNADGVAMRGVMIRLTDPESGVSESVYSNERGRYTLVTDLQGKLQLRARTPYFEDVRGEVELGPTGAVSRDVYHFGSLPFEEGDDADFNRLQFQRDCLSCHQIGNPMTRQPRSPESWAASIERMHLYLGNFDMKLRDARGVILSRGFTGKPLTVRPQFPLDPALSHAKVYEYTLERAGVPHDAIYNPKDGLLYTVDQALDHMAVTDRATGATEYVLQAGGPAMSYRSGMAGGANVVGEFNPGARHGPHSLAMGHDGLYYTTNTGTRSIGVFNPETRRWEATHAIAEETGAVYPHTIRVDATGMVWFTLAGSEHVGRLDPRSGEFTILALPLHKPMGIAGTTQPYGIDISPSDNSVWYGRLFADRIGRIDTATLEITEYESPVSGPRRMHFDKQGTLWVAGYSTGMLARVDVSETLEERSGGINSKVYALPGFAEGYRPAPYALGVHPQTQEIWINENMTDRIFRFIPGEERFVVYPVPLRGTYTRDMTFTAEGHVCTSNNPIPAPALEGGVLQIICLDPDYRPDDSPRLAMGNGE
jgi:streptogramin lyase